MSDETSAAIADDTKLVAGIIRETWTYRERTENAHLSDEFVLRHWATSAAAVRIALDAGRAAASSDLDAIKREAAREAAREALAKAIAAFTAAKLAMERDTSVDEVVANLRAFRDREYPAPAPEPPHVTLSDGSVVTYNANGNKDHHDGYPWRRSQNGTDGHITRVWPSLMRSTDTGADFDALKAFAVRVLALREGRGDQ